MVDLNLNNEWLSTVNKKSRNANFYKKRSSHILNRKLPFLASPLIQKNAPIQTSLRDFFHNSQNIVNSKMIGKHLCNNEHIFFHSGRNKSNNSIKQNISLIGKENANSRVSDNLGMLETSADTDSTSLDSNDNYVLRRDYSKNINYLSAVNFTNNSQRINCVTKTNYDMFKSTKCKDDIVMSNTYFEYNSDATITADNFNEINILPDLRFCLRRQSKRLNTDNDDNSLHNNSDLPRPRLGNEFNENKANSHSLNTDLSTTKNLKDNILVQSQLNVEECLQYLDLPSQQINNVNGDNFIYINADEETSNIDDRVLAVNNANNDIYQNNVDSSILASNIGNRFLDANDVYRDNCVERILYKLNLGDLVVDCNSCGKEYDKFFPMETEPQPSLEINWNILVDYFEKDLNKIYSDIMNSEE